MINVSRIESILKNHFKTPLLNLRVQTLSGGDIHSSVALTLNGGAQLPARLFAKFNSGRGADVLSTEFASLQLINDLVPARYPNAILFDQHNGDAVLVMQFHNLGSLSADNAANAGRALAEQHKVVHTVFGWASDNYIGLTPQSNQWMSDWVEFFREQRLRPMLKRAETMGLSPSSVVKARQVIVSLDKLLNHTVVPSLVHGDLWSGNLGFDNDCSTPLFYDPAPYYGDREVDIAMTTLFGRQADAFYQAYQAVWPLEYGYENRQCVYNLYHALNHVVLFGLSYNSLVDACLVQIDTH